MSLTFRALPEQYGSSEPLIAPSMLKCDFGNLRDEIRQLEAAGAQCLHWDVMDGHFVPNLSYGALLIERLRPRTDLWFEAHLMISEPARYVEEYLRAGCDCVTFHLEAVPEPLPLLRRIRQAGAKAGLALNPGTSVSRIMPFLAECDLVLVMSVEPGFGGQKFMPPVLEKVRHVSQHMNPGTLLSIDGGIGPSTIAAAAAAGAGVFVVGSAIFEAADYRAALEDLTQRAAASMAFSSVE